jgi:hypothetical protein
MITTYAWAAQCPHFVSLDAQHFERQAQPSLRRAVNPTALGSAAEKGSALVIEDAAYD